MNNSNNLSTTNDAAVNINDVSVDDITLVIVALILSISIISVNFITIIVIKKIRRLQTVSNMYIVSLAAADLVVGLGLLPLSVFYIPSIRRDYYDRNVNFCVFVFGINLGMAVVSTLHMALIATDRYLYIVWPYLYQKYVQRKLVFGILACTWIFGLFYSLLPQFIHQDASKVSKCDITIIMPKSFIFYSNVSIYIMCSIIDVAMYSQILVIASRQRRVIRCKSQSVDGYNTDGSLSDTSTDVAQCTISTICFNRLTAAPNQSLHLSNTDRFQQETATHNDQNTDSNNTSEPSYEQNIQANPLKRVSRTSLMSARIKNRSRRLKSVRFFMIVFGVYFICLTPTVVCMGIDYYTPIPRIIYNLFNLLALLNSGMNFIIFFALNSRFRSSVLKVCRCGTFTGHLNSNDMPFFDS
ncbi:hypothetical protein BsWGS_28178 [Bradybaena similaris]